METSSPQLPSKEELLKAALKETIASPEFALAIRTILENARPVPNKTLSGKVGNYPYYKASYALELKTVFDMMIEDSKDKEFKYSSFPHLSRNSIYLRVYQSIQYLLDAMDTPDKKYAKFYEMCQITREPTGVCIRIVRDRLSGNIPFKPEDISDKVCAAEWRDKIDKFLNDEKKAVLHIKNLRLSTDEISTLEESLVGVPVISLITEREIKIVKEDFQKPVEEE